MTTLDCPWTYELPPFRHVERPIPGRTGVWPPRVKTIIIMDFIPPLSCPKYAPLQLGHNLDNHLQLSLMDTYQSAEETPRCLQHKSPPPHSGRPLARLRHKRIDSHPHRTTTPNDNNSLNYVQVPSDTSAVCNPALKSSTFWPPPHLQHGAAGPTKSSKTHRCP